MVSLKLECLFVASIQKYNSFLFTDLESYSLSIITYYSVQHYKQSIGFSIYLIILPVKVFFLLFQNMSFVFFLALYWLDCSAWCSTEVVRADIPVLFLIYPLSFIIKYDVSDSFSINVLYESKEIPHNS